MALTLLEAAKMEKGDVMLQAVVETFARESDILRVLPFRTISGNSYKYNREDTLPGIGFRGVNEGFSESTGIINPQMEPLVIAGGDLDVDRFIIQTEDASRREAEEERKLKALSHAWGQKVVKGSSTTDPKEFDGLQVRLGGAQLVAAGATANGDALSLNKMDEAIDAVDSPTHLLMSKAMKRRFKAAARSTSVGGTINYQPDEFGRQIETYNGYPILVADGNDQNNPALAFDEANPGGGTNTGTSIYVLSLMDGMLFGLQNGMPRATDLGELETKPVFRTRVEWYAGLCLQHPRAACRLWGIKDAAIVA